MQEVKYGNRILEFPDGMSEDEMGLAICELPEEKAIAERGSILPYERYKAGLTLERINPTVAREVRRIALERKHGYIAKDPPSIANFIRNIPEDVHEFTTELSSLIGMVGLFTYRFGSNLIQDINDITKRDFMAFDKPPSPDRVQKQLTPAGLFGKAVYYDFKAMFTGDLPKDYRPVTEMKDALMKKVERQGLGDTLKYWAQDNPVDVILISLILKKLAADGTRYSLQGIQKIAPKASKMSKVLDSVLSTKRTPLVFTLGPKKDLAEVATRIQKQAVHLLKGGDQIGSLSLDDVIKLAIYHPGKAISHVRRSKNVPIDEVLEGMRNKGLGAMAKLPKNERPAAAKNLQLAVDRIDKMRIKQTKALSTISRQSRLTKKTGGSTFRSTGEDLIGSDNYAVSLFPDYSKVVKGKLTKKKLADFYLANEDLLKQYPELAVGTWTETGQTYIDLVATIPTANKYAALGMARRYNQKAIFNLKTMETINTKGSGAVLGGLPSVEQRMEEIRRIAPVALKPPTGVATLQHWTTKKGLAKIDPAKYGTGLKGAEAERKLADPKNWIDRSYYGVKDGGYVPEAGLGTVKYEVDIPFKKLYDFNNDPLNLKGIAVKTRKVVPKKGTGEVRVSPKGERFDLPGDKGFEWPVGKVASVRDQMKEGNPISLYERAIKEKGFAGYYVNSATKGNVVALFDKVAPKVKPAAEKMVAFERKYSDDIFTKYIFQNTFDAGLEKFPYMKKTLIEHKAKRFVSTMRNLSDEANFNERSKMHAEIYKQINTLTKEEQKVIVPYLEGRAALIHEPTEQFKAFEGWYRGLIAKHEAHLKKVGRSVASQDRLYQPLAEATGQSLAKVKTDLGNFTPVYVHHTFPEMHNPKMSIHFAETTGKRFAPSWAKKCRGVEGYSEDFKEILPKYVSEYIKFKHTEKFIHDFTNKFGIRVSAAELKEIEGVLHHGKDAYPGYKILAPDGFLSYYRGKIDIQKEIIKRMENTTFDEAVGAMLAEMNLPVKSYMGVAKNKIVYLIPEEMMGELETFATPIFGSKKVQDVVRLTIDKPTQVWKDSVLLSPRWVKNNVMGDILFNSTKGVGPMSYSRAFRDIYVDCIPDRLLQASFANVMKYNPKLGKTAETAIGGFVQTLYDSKIVAGAGRVKDLGYAMNTMFEQPFVRALYIHLSRKKAIKLLKTAKVARTEVNILNKMRAIKADELLCVPLVEEVHKTLPVFNLLGNFERKYIRRFVPFANWYKFMIQHGATLPAKHPFKAVGARGLCLLSEQQREEVFRDYFPYMSREIDDSGIPEKFDHLWPIGDKGAEMAKFFNARGMNPYTTVEDFVDLDFLNMASPIITVPLEQMTGRTTFGGRRYESGEAGISVTHNGVEWKEFSKVRPPLVEHILSQTPQYTRLKEWLVPARQWDTGTLLNPDPILDPNTGEYKYPIESIEKILNMLGVDHKTLEIREVWYRWQARKAQALGRALSKNRENLSFEDIRNIMEEIQKDKKLWQQLQDEMNEKAYYEQEKARELKEKVSKQ